MNRLFNLQRRSQNRSKIFLIENKYKATLHHHAGFSVAAENHRLFRIVKPCTVITIRQFTRSGLNMVPWQIAARTGRRPAIDDKPQIDLAQAGMVGGYSLDARSACQARGAGKDGRGPPVVVQGYEGRFLLVIGIGMVRGNEDSRFLLMVAPLLKAEQTPRKTSAKYNLCG